MNTTLITMKTIITILLSLLMATACSNTSGKTSVENDSVKDGTLEVLYFHNAKRCATCIAIENGTKELLQSTFREQLQDSTIIFRTINIQDNKDLCEKYQISWSSLIMVDHEDGKESVKNLTDFAFAKARTNPEVFKNELSAQITNMLE